MKKERGEATWMMFYKVLTYRLSSEIGLTFFFGSKRRVGQIPSG